MASLDVDAHQQNRGFSSERITKNPGSREGTISHLFFVFSSFQWPARSLLSGFPSYAM